MTFLVVPWIKWGKYLAAHQELYRCRSRAVLTSVGAVAVVALIAGWVPVPDRDRAAALVEPLRLERLYAGADGFVTSAAPSGGAVTANTALVLSETAP